MRPAGLVVLTSPQDFKDAVRRLVDSIADLNLRLVSRTDHAAAATDADLRLRPVAVLTLEDPVAGASLVDAVPTIAVDLPLRVVVWAEGGRTMVAYTDPHWLAQRHGEPACQNAVIRSLAARLAAVARAATACRRDRVGGPSRYSPARPEAPLPSPSAQDARNPSWDADVRASQHRATRRVQDIGVDDAIAGSGADD